MTNKKVFTILDKDGNKIYLNEDQIFVEETLDEVINDDSKEELAERIADKIEEKDEIAEAREIIRENDRKKENRKKYMAVGLAVVIGATAMYALQKCDPFGNNKEIVIELEENEIDYDEIVEEVVEAVVPMVEEASEAGIYDIEGIEGLTIEQMVNYWISMNYDELDPKEHAILYKGSLTGASILRDADTSMNYIAAHSRFAKTDERIFLEDYITNERDSKAVSDFQKSLAEWNTRGSENKKETEQKINDQLETLYKDGGWRAISPRANAMIISLAYEAHFDMDLDKEIHEAIIAFADEREICEDEVASLYHDSKMEGEAEFVEWLERLRVIQEEKSLESRYDEIIQLIKERAIIVEVEKFNYEEKDLATKTPEQQAIVREINEGNGKNTAPKVIKTETITPKVVTPVPGVPETEKPMTQTEINNYNQNQANYWESFRLGNNQGVADAIKDNELGRNTNYNSQNVPSSVTDRAAYIEGYDKGYLDTRNQFLETQNKLVEDLNKNLPAGGVIHKESESIYYDTVGSDFGYDKDGNPTYKGEPVELHDPNRTAPAPTEQIINTTEDIGNTPAQTSGTYIEPSPTDDIQPGEELKFEEGSDTILLNSVDLKELRNQLVASLENNQDTLNKTKA